jgi:hypothetical protein
MQLLLVVLLLKQMEVLLQYLVLMLKLLMFLGPVCKAAAK